LRIRRGALALNFPSLNKPELRAALLRDYRRHGNGYHCIHKIGECDQTGTHSTHQSGNSPNQNQCHPICSQFQTSKPSPGLEPDEGVGKDGARRVEPRCRAKDPRQDQNSEAGVPASRNNKQGAKTIDIEAQRKAAQITRRPFSPRSSTAKKMTEAIGRPQFSTHDEYLFVNYGGRQLGGLLVDLAELLFQFGNPLVDTP